MTKNLNIYVATMTGTALMVADEIEEFCKNNDLNTKIHEMDVLEPESLLNVKSPILIISSTYGQGDVPDGSKKGTQLNLGLIAQDEIEVEKEHGYGDTPDNMLVADINGDGNYGMQYSKLVPILINSVKELSAENTALKARLDAAGL